MSACWFMLVVSSPSHDKSTMSYFESSAFDDQSDFELCGAPGDVFGAPPRPNSPDVGAPWKMWMRPAPLAPPPYSLASSPTRRRRHSSVSAPPVEIAML